MKDKTDYEVQGEIKMKFKHTATETIHTKFIKDKRGRKIGYIKHSVRKELK